MRTCYNDSIKKNGVFICSNCGIYLDIARMDEGHEDDDYEPCVCPECGLPVEKQTPTATERTDSVERVALDMLHYCCGCLAHDMVNHHEEITYKYRMDDYAARLRALGVEVTENER